MRDEHRTECWIRFSKPHLSSYPASCSRSLGSNPCRYVVSNDCSCQPRQGFWISEHIPWWVRTPAVDGTIGRWRMDHHTDVRKLPWNERQSYQMTELYYWIEPRSFQPTAKPCQRGVRWWTKLLISPLNRDVVAFQCRVNIAEENRCTPPPHQRRALVWPWDWRS